MRAEATVRNSFWGLFQQLVICVLSIYSRRVMLDTIHIEGVGLNGLLTNVVAVLALAEMGVGTTLVYHMYKPLATGDDDTITRLMNFYSNVYRFIALTIFVVGMCLMPFMKYIVKDVDYSDGYVMWIYFLFLMQTVTTYLFAYKRSILAADQKQYIVSIYDLVFKILTVAGGIVILLLTKNFALYLIFLIISAVINNLMIANKVNHMYPFVKNRKPKLQKEYRHNIFKDIKNIFISKLSGTVTNSTDNILISALVGTVTTGLYSNYTIILNTLTSIMNQFSYSMMGSIGNLIAVETKEHIEDVYKKLVFLMFFMAAFCCICLSCLIDPFITIVFGDNLLLERYVVYISITIFYFATIKIPVWNMISGAGLFKMDKYISILGTTINLIVSFILGSYIGIGGILLGTICTYVIQYNLKIVLFYNSFLHKKCYKMLLSTYAYFIFTAGECLLASYLTSLIPIANPFFKFIVSAVVAAIFALGLNSLIFWKKREFVYFREKMLAIVFKKKQKA